MIDLFYIKHVLSLKASYQLAYPFPHIILDNFIEPSLLRTVLDECIQNKIWHTDETLGHYQSNKYYLPNVDEIDLTAYERVMPITKFLLEYLNSVEALPWLSALTGIEDLEPDHTFFGAGVHRVSSGGRLSIHADFNKHRRTNLYRRVNLLLYLNPVWEKSWGGYLELWDKNLSTKCADIPPIFNRAVIFSTSDHSFHGHPVVLSLPDGVCRYSIAMYYYSKESGEDTDQEWRPVQWKDVA